MTDTISGANGVPRRNNKGQSAAVLILFLAVFLVGPLSFVAYEVSVCNLAKQQLRNCVESAVLGASRVPVVAPKTDALTHLITAENAALWMFQQNSILGSPLVNASISTSISPTIGANQSFLYFRLLDPQTTGRSVSATSDQKVKIIEVTASYGFVPQFAKFFGFGGTWEISATAQAPMTGKIVN